ncbi:GNAT family N-acetyltransferase [Streptomyces niveus]|uniref:GNAT family N-acetyltransferase n=1 Tax=Streptomyces niveus TaxID=193462 RepID=UPI00362979E2
MNELTIRPRADDHMRGCVQALATVYAADRYPVDWPVDPEGWLPPRRMLHAWVAVDGSAVLGHLVLARPGEALAIAVGLPAQRLVSVARFFVGTGARRRGVAVRLLDKAIEVAAADDSGRFWKSKPGRPPPSTSMSVPDGATSPVPQLTG